ncbi:MAG TPA: glycoside hydrolase family 2 TIM barrel-domain containing protein [Terriglobales bacterium]|nr:glycoside hydrolase family 2 TIM barrel-domain containing protein [Terriglobales bacterium]
MRTRLLLLIALLISLPVFGQSSERGIGNWQMQDASKVKEIGSVVSTSKFKPESWYAAAVPGTVLTTLVNNKVYPEPLYGENMRQIPESLNKTDWWYRTTFNVPKDFKGRHVWLHFAGINYSAEIWVNGHEAGTMKGAFIRGDFDISEDVKPGKSAVLAVLVKPQPHPGVPIEHTVANGVGKNGGDTAIDGPTFLCTIGWDWLPAVRDRDTGIWLPVTLDTTGPVILKDPFVTSDLSPPFKTADLHVSTTLENKSAQAVTGTLTGTIQWQNGPEQPVTFNKPVTLAANSKQDISFDKDSTPELHLDNPKLWWPNGYGPQNLYTLTMRFDIGGKESSTESRQFGIRKIEYHVPDSEDLTLAVNGVKIMARGGNWGLDEGMKRITRERLDAQFHMHALANLNIIRNWVGQSTSPDFYDMADKYGILLWDEFFQPNPADGPNVTDIPTYLANVTDKVVRYRNHPSIAVWCARNEGYPPKELEDDLKPLMTKLDPSRLYQSNSAEGRGVSSGGPYYWRSPRFFYAISESFKTETGSVSVPTLESIQGMMPQKDWETINDDWAQHDMAHGAQRGDEFPGELAHRYGHIRNLADFVRKGQLATYEAFRAMYEGRNSEMFKTTSGVITWMSNPAQPSFVWQLYHYDLEPNAALYAAKKASEPVHVQLNEALRGIEVVNNRPESLKDLKLEVMMYRFDGQPDFQRVYSIAEVPGETTQKVAQAPNAYDTALFFIKLNLRDAGGTLLSTNFYWQQVAQDQFGGLQDLPPVTLDAKADAHTEGDNTLLTVTLANNTSHIALMSHLQLHQKKSGKRVLPVFYSDNYLSLIPGESTTVTIEAATKDFQGDDPLIEVDGYNVDVKPVDGPVSIATNVNAQPSHWPESNIVPEEK